MRLDAKNNEAIREFENWVKDELYGLRKEAKETQPMSTTATNEENVSFRIQDQNRSTFWVESRPKDFRVGVEVLGQGVNYFHFTPEQYKIFIHSEFNRIHRSNQ